MSHRRRIIVGGAAIAAAVGCEAPRGPVSIYSEDPDLHVRAIRRDVAMHDDHDVPTMVHDLDDDDPAIRFYSIQGLRRLSGDEFGYQFWDDAETRRPAIGRWRAWLANGGGR